MTFYKTIPQKIDDFVAEYGLPKSIIKPSNNNPCAFAIDGHYYLTIVAESELDELARWLANEKVYAKYGGGDSFLVGAPIELLDSCAKPEMWESIAREYYTKKANDAASRSYYGYPNMLAGIAVNNDVIDNEDLDRYFVSGGAWRDASAKEDLINKYVNVMSERALKHPCSWYLENEKSMYGSRYNLRDFICKKKSLMDRKAAVDLALEWEMDHLGVTNSTDYLAQFFAHWDGKVRRIGEFYAFFNGNPELLRRDPKTWTFMELIATGPDKKDSELETPVTEDTDNSSNSKRYWDDWLMDKHPDMTDDDATDFAYFTDDYFKTEDYTNYKVPMTEDQFDEVYNAWREEQEDTVNAEPSYLDDDDPFAGL